MLCRAMKIVFILILPIKLKWINYKKGQKIDKKNLFILLQEMLSSNKIIQFFFST